ncbi:glycine/betaine ABC transporter substrate-binding protein [Marinobacterium zhoushanense]|uniref:Glycine/betaine ABC transporter substrate-binding protein n=1 Tax=Marinobacterium zhoushanense TaxID=1679163 RepID=A0ABQ1KG56_9GAMM|nr:choline ABC transporter substrate-binding protein [Marinobacterium zhoushanense]GGB95959.1 glycine/betaine ABC transporter substrate-binding protein [Marinobacterium zhoushanense]
MKTFKKTLTAAVLSSIMLGGIAHASDPAECKEVRFTDPGWTDINSTNGVASVLLNSLGYAPRVQTLAVPIGFEGMKNGEIDIFLGNWMPAQQKFIDRYKDDLDVIGVNLEGAKFTLAVPSYAYAAGVHDFADLAKFPDQFDMRIYGIEAGAPANQLLQNMVDSNDFSLGEWRVVESGEQGVMAQVRRAVKRKEFIVFLGWEPHPMNSNLEMNYLTGGDKYFGPNFGGAEVQTVTRSGYADQCGNVGKLLSNLKFTLAMENQIMGLILDEKMDPVIAARNWVKKNPDALDAWLDGVTTFDGKPGLAAVKGSLGIN